MLLRREQRFTTASCDTGAATGAIAGWKPIACLPFEVDDALHATRAAIAEGIVPGSGVAHLNLRGALDAVETTFEENRMALNMLRRALEEPTCQIVANAGLDGAVVVEEIKRRQGAQDNRFRREDR